MMTSIKQKIIADVKITTFRSNKIKNILVVGATQNGKSTFCNFMALNKKDYTPIFKIGNGQVSETKFLQDHIFEYKYTNQIDNLNIEKIIVRYRIIDTPGVGDTELNSEEINMLNFYSRLLEMGKNDEEICGVIICCKLGNLLNEEYRNNLNFYKKMLNDIFDVNVIVVITDVRNNPAWIREKTRNGDTIQNIIKQFKDKIFSSLGLNKNIACYQLNADPFEDDDYNIATTIRSNILDQCFNVKISIKKLKFVKIIPFKKQDNEKIIGLRGDLKGIQKGIEIANKELGVITSKIKKLNEIVSKQKKIVTNLKETLDDLDNENLYLLETFQLTDDWHFFGRAKGEYEYNTNKTITSYITSQGWFKKEIDTNNHIKGIVENKLWNKLGSILSIYTTKRIYYNDQIIGTREKLNNEEIILSTKENDLNDYNSKQDQTNEQLSEYKVEIDRVNKIINQLNNDFLTHEELEIYINGIK